MFSTAMNTRDTSLSKAKATSMAVSIHDFKTLLASYSSVLPIRPDAVYPRTPRIHIHTRRKGTSIFAGKYVVTSWVCGVFGHQCMDIVSWDGDLYEWSLQSCKSIIHTPSTSFLCVMAQLEQIPGTDFIVVLYR